MLELITIYGTFGKHTDLLRFMEEENIEEIEVELRYVFQTVIKHRLTREHIKMIIAKDEVTY